MAWDSTTLCSQTDIENRVGSLTLYTQAASDEEASARVTTAIEQAGTLITSKLKSTLPNVFASTVGQYTNLTFGDWVTQRGYTLSDLDTMLDTLTNVTVLMPYAVALSLQLLCEQRVALFSAANDQNLPLMIEQRDYWTKEAKRLETECVSQLTFDLSGDGTVQDFERVDTHNVIFRT
jgi:hypothetical protein